MDNDDQDEMNTSKRLNASIFGATDNEHSMSYAVDSDRSMSMQMADSWGEDTQKRF